MLIYNINHIFKIYPVSFLFFIPYYIINIIIQITINSLYLELMAEETVEEILASAMEVELHGAIKKDNKGQNP